MTYGDPATVFGCDIYLTTGILEQADPPSPRIGTMALETDARYPGTGYLITDYQPC